MADAKQVIELIFEGVDKTAAATQSALDNTDKFAKNVQGATQPIADFTLGAVKLEAALLTAGVAVVGLSVAMASDFQSAAIDLQKVLSDTDDIEEYKDLAIEMSQKYGIASTDVLASITNFKQAGFTADEATTLVTNGLDAMIAGNVAADASSALLVAGLKGFGVGAKEAASHVDILNQVSNDYAVSFSELQQGFVDFSPVAKLAGLSLQETIGILTPGIEVFQSGSEVARALRTSFLNLSQVTPKVTDAMKVLGVSQLDTNGQMRSGRDLFFEVADSLLKMDDTQQLFYANQLVGKNAVDKFIAVIKGLDSTLTIASPKFKFLGSAAVEVAAQLASAETAANRVGTSINNMLIGFGSNFLEEFTGTANAITEIFLAIAKSGENANVAALVEFIESQFAGLQESLELVAKNLPKALEDADFSGFSEGVKVITESLGLLFDDIDITSVEGLTKAIELAGSAFHGLSQFTGGVIESFKPMFDKITDVGKGLAELEPETFKIAGNLAGFATQANIVSGALVSMMPLIEAAVALFGVNQALSLGGVLISAGKAAGVFSLAFAAIGGAAVAVGVAISPLINKMSELVTGVPLNTWATDAAIALFGLDDAAGDIVDSLNEIPLDEVRVDADASAKAIADADAAMAAMGKSSGEASGKVYDFATGLEVAGDATEELEDGVGFITELPDIFGKAGDAVTYMGEANESAGGSFSVIGTEASKAAESVEDLTTASEKMTHELNLARIEAASAATTARIEADAAKTVAAFDSISNSITSTGDTLQTLFGLLGDDNISKLDKLDISKAIKEEQELREKAFELQERLTESQIRALDAQTASLAGGDALITVNGDGLAPHLEAMMFEVLEAVQVRVNADGYAQLLGSGA